MHSSGNKVLLPYLKLKKLHNYSHKGNLPYLQGNIAVPLRENGRIFIKTPIREICRIFKGMTPYLQGNIAVSLSDFCRILKAKNLNFTGFSILLKKERKIVV